MPPATHPTVLVPVPSAAATPAAPWGKTRGWHGIRAVCGWLGKGGHLPPLPLRLPVGWKGWS